MFSSGEGFLFSLTFLFESFLFFIGFSFRIFPFLSFDFSSSASFFWSYYQGSAAGSALPLEIKFCLETGGTSRVRGHTSL